jgi:hypothetical protein
MKWPKTSSRIKQSLHGCRKYTSSNNQRERFSHFMIDAEIDAGEGARAFCKLSESYVIWQASWL